MIYVGHYNDIPVYEDPNCPPGMIYFILGECFMPFTTLQKLPHYKRVWASLHRNHYRGSHVIISFCQATAVRGRKMVPEIAAIYKKVRLLCHKAVKWMR